MNSSGWVVVVAVLVLIAGGTWWYTQQPAAPANVGGEQAIPNETGSNVPAQGTTEPKTVTVNYSNTGFSPASITIAKGDTVTFTNSASGTMWVAADEHPAHTGYDGTTRAAHCVEGYSGAVPFDQCKTGADYSFKFDKAGSFDYHNHAAAQFGGTVVVQ